MSPSSIRVSGMNLKKEDRSANCRLFISLSMRETPKLTGYMLLQLIQQPHEQTHVLPLNLLLLNFCTLRKRKTNSKKTAKKQNCFVMFYAAN